jgi:hypothetical protein
MGFVIMLFKLLLATWTKWLPPTIVLLFTLEAFWSSWKQRRKIQQILEETSTRFLGPFPRHLEYLREIIDRAESEVVIMADCADYGSFSQPEAHNAVVHAIENARMPSRNVTVRLLICGEPQSITRASRFWGISLEELRKDKEFNRCFTSYFTLHPPAPDTDDQFKERLGESQNNCERRLREATVEIGKLPSEISELFLWIADDNEAVFLFPNNDIGVSGLAFRTRDSRLIEKNFKPLFQRKWKKYLDEK